MSPEYYQEVRQRLHEEMISAIPTLETYTDEWAQKTGRKMKLVEPYRCDDAEVILVTSGTPSVTAQVVIDEYRERGEKVGLLALRLFRPFPEGTSLEDSGRRAQGSRHGPELLLRPSWHLVPRVEVVVVHHAR